VYDLSVYNDKFYEDFGWEAQEMAKWFLPLLQKILPFQTFVDVGCGEGHYLHWLEKNGFSPFGLFGIEGSRTAIVRSPVNHLIVNRDLRFPIKPLEKKYDLCMSLEVAEHIEEQYAQTFVNTLCGLSDTVVMTAAPKGQGGEHHVNEQGKAYWIEKMYQAKFQIDAVACADLNNGIHHKAVDDYITPWLRKNLMVFRRAL
jgi:SAM-dependent methyltransferase